MNSRRIAVFSLAVLAAMPTIGQAQSQRLAAWQAPGMNTIEGQNVNFAQQQAMMRQRQVMQPVQPMQFQQQPQQFVQQQQMNPQFIPANQIARMPQAAQPTRITGSLPAVGNNSGNIAGRQYLQPSQFDRLAESGLYMGLSLAYSYSVLGGITSDYSGYLVPGNASSVGYGENGTILPLQISVGAALNSDVRVDFSYNRYSGINYPSMVKARDGAGGYVDLQAFDGAITSNITMLNVYYNVDKYMGNLVGGVLRPYVGVGLGIGLNTIGDYIVYDPEYYAEIDNDYFAIAPPGILAGVSNIYAYHSGGTTEQLAYMLEGGLTSTLESGMRVDFFLRYMNMGKVESSGSVVLSQTEWLTTGDGGEFEGDYASVFHYTDYKESGNLASIDIGVRLRIQF
ncbi:MAG: hypothetical protein LBG89_00550 [Rickettsiales bacterium]|jgi:hypothetical protein|nr:hypothetical protein [Rickettsiales bacterium]